MSCTVHDVTTDELLESLTVTELQRSSTSSTSSTLTSPPRTINLEAAQQVAKIAKIAYRELNLSGLATFDFIVKVVRNKYHHRHTKYHVTRVTVILSTTSQTSQ